jgi:hypothetical protein
LKKSGQYYYVMVVPTALHCRMPGCTMGEGGAAYTTLPHHHSQDQVTQDLTNHIAIHTAIAMGAGAAQNQPQGGPRPCRLDRPQVDEGCSDSDWQVFLQEWTRYKRATRLEGIASVDQLWGCMSGTLGRAAHNDGADECNTEVLLLARMKKLAVKRQNVLVNQVKFLQLGQERDEPVSAFVARLRGQANVCEFTLKCSGCDHVTSYMERIMAHQLVRALVDPGIQERVLASAADKADMTLTELIAVVEAQEMAKRSQGLLAGAGGLHRMTEYKAGVQTGKLMKNQPGSKTQQPTRPDGPVCKHCGLSGHGSSHKEREKSCKAFSLTCHNCKVKGHLASQCASAKVASVEVASIEEVSKPEESAARVSGIMQHTGNFFALSTRPAPRPGWSLVCSKAEAKRIRQESRDKLDCSLSPDLGRHLVGRPVVTSARVAGVKAKVGHHVHVDGAWVRSGVDPHPMLNGLRVSVDHSGYVAVGQQDPGSIKTVVTRGLVDTGAQMTVLGLQLLDSLGVSLEELFPAQLNILTADESGLDIIGAVFINIETSDGRITKEMGYVARAAQHFFVSFSALKKLGMMDGLKSAGISAVQQSAPLQECTPAEECLTEPVLEYKEPKYDDCGCLRRTPPPALPNVIPFEPIEGNIGKLKDWIVEHFASSSFNQCIHKPLPLIKSMPPLYLHVDPDAKPVCVTRPATVPLHFQEDVLAGLLKDVQLGVLERVPLNTPDTWCSRMVIATKKDGKPRRTVDFKPVNASSPRQTHIVEAPYMQAISVPPRTWRTTLDAWEGYHSVPIAIEDAHKTTFITPWGRFRYLVAPQGFLSSNDGYCARYDMVTKDVKNYKRCVDDTILWEDYIEEQFWSTCRYLSLTATNGYIMNLKKFIFCQCELEYVGFWLKEDGIRPTEDMLKAIRDFPRPTDISGIRSFFGLVEQVAWAFSKTDAMSPFRPLLSPKTMFVWTDALQVAFLKARLKIVDLCAAGVKSFDKSRTTCLNTDWSETGISFNILQKTCKCVKIDIRCCHGGWHLVLCKSRFCSVAESRYSPIEGEALAVAYGFEQGKYYLLGAADLYLAVDHRPLLGIYRPDRNIDEIANQRLLNLVEKTQRYRFKTFHVSGRANSAADSLSRYPVSKAVHMELLSLCATVITSEEQRQSDERDVLATAALAASLEGVENPVLDESGQVSLAQVRLVSWRQLEDECKQDEEYQRVLSHIQSGGSDPWPEGARGMAKYKDKLSTVGSVILFGTRAVIPVSLRSTVLDCLHSGHQGVTGMMSRVMSSVWWPRVNEDVISKRQACQSCDVATPSQPAAPPQGTPVPDFPFQQVCTDYFSLQGFSFCVIVDRYSGWPSVFRAQKSTSRELIEFLREYFVTFGAPEELSSDGASQFTSHETRKFLEDWGVKQRISSAYFPHSNTRAEVAVKTVKRMIRSHVGPGGSLSNEGFARALLQYRNTPDRDLKMSPAQVVFGHSVRDFIPGQLGNYQPRQEWKLTSEMREKALARRHLRKEESLEIATRSLAPLTVGQLVMVQNQTGQHKLKWDKSGVVCEVLLHDQYMIRMDGSGRVSLRNRRFLKCIVPFLDETLLLVRDKSDKTSDVDHSVPKNGATSIENDSYVVQNVENGLSYVPTADVVPPQDLKLRRSSRRRNVPDYFQAGAISEQFSVLQSAG